MPVPFLYLSDQCEITDISEKLRSLPAKMPGKDFLRSILSKSSAERLEEFCQSGRNTPPMTLPLKKKYLGCVKVTAVRCSSGGVHLYLADEDDGKYKSAEASDTASKSLTVGSTATDIGTFLRVCTQTSLSIEDRISSASLSSSSYYPVLLETVTSLISALATVSTGTITLSSASRGMETELYVSADTDIIPPFTGNCFDVTSLAPYLRGSRAHLLKASASAQSIGFVLSAVFSPSGRLSFTASNVPSLLPYTEFKLPTGDETSSRIIGSLTELLLAVDKEQDE